MIHTRENRSNERQKPSSTPGCTTRRRKVTSGATLAHHGSAAPTTASSSRGYAKCLSRTPWTVGRMGVWTLAGTASTAGVLTSTTSEDGKATRANIWDSLQPHDHRQSGVRGSATRVGVGHTVTDVGLTVEEGLATTSTAASFTAPRTRLRDRDVFAPRASPRRGTGACSGKPDNGMLPSHAGHASRCGGDRLRERSQIGCAWTRTRGPTTMFTDAGGDRRPTLEVCCEVGRLQPGTGRQRGAGHRTCGGEACPLPTWLFVARTLLPASSQQLIRNQVLSRGRRKALGRSTFSLMAFVARYHCQFFVCSWARAGQPSTTCMASLTNDLPR